MESIIPLLILGAVVAAAYVGWKGYYRIPQGHVGIVYRRSLRNSELEWQPLSLREGYSGWYPPGFYRIRHVLWTYVPPDQVGLVTAREGRQRGRGQTFGVLSEEARDAVDNFQNGLEFLRLGGQQGPQAAVLPGGQRYSINPELFTVTFEPRTEVPQGSIGLVIAKKGQALPRDRSYAWPIECEYFQDGDAFLLGGGEQGRQLALLPGGAGYDINPELFDVITVRNVDAHGGGMTADRLRLVDIPADHIGVVITLVGRTPNADASGFLGPRVDGHSQFQRPEIFLAGGGYRGVQSETLGEGVYQLNPWFVAVVLVPTRMITLEWGVKTPPDQENYDVELERLAVAIKGYTVEMDLMQTLKIPREAAPRLVKEFGGQQISPEDGLGGLVRDRKPIQRFVERVLGATVTTYLSRTASETTVREFLSRHREVSQNLTTQVRHALKSQGVESIDTSLGLFQPDERLAEELQKESRTDLELGRMSQEKSAAEQRDEIHEIANRSAKRELANDLEVLIDQMGRDNAIVIRMIEAMSNLPMPSTIMGSDVSRIIDTLPTAQITRMIDGLREQAGERPLMGTPIPPQLTAKPKFLLNPDTKEFAVALVLCAPRLREPGRTAPPPSPQQIADTIMSLSNVTPGLGIRDRFVQEINAQLKGLRAQVRRHGLIAPSQQLTTASLPKILLDHGVLAPHHLAVLQDQDWLDYQASEWREVA